MKNINPIFFRIGTSDIMRFSRLGKVLSKTRTNRVTRGSNVPNFKLVGHLVSEIYLINKYHFAFICVININLDTHILQLSRIIIRLIFQFYYVNFFYGFLIIISSSSFALSITCTHVCGFQSSRN